MLRKLIKYEWKGFYKMGLILLGVVVFATLLGFLASRSPLWSDVRVYDSFAAGLATTISVFSIILYIILLAGTVYAMLIYTAVRFYRTMYTDEGYLLHTLPVTKHQILISKLLVSSIWLLITYIVMFASVFSFIMFIMEAVSPGSVGQMMAYLPGLFDELWRELGYMSGKDRVELAYMITSMFLSLLVSIPAGIITIFGAISLGQLFSKHRVLMAILCYVGINIVMSIISNVIRSISYTGIYLYDYEEGLGYLLTFLNSTLVKGLLEGVGFYLLSYFITSRKLNME